MDYEPVEVYKGLRSQALGTAIQTRLRSESDADIKFVPPADAGVLSGPVTGYRGYVLARRCIAIMTACGFKHASH
jgi:hypothetical protein